jgi:hypothetical protein
VCLLQVPIHSSSMEGRMEKPLEGRKGRKGKEHERHVQMARSFFRFGPFFFRSVARFAQIPILIRP